MKNTTVVYISCEDCGNTDIIYDDKPGEINYCMKCGSPKIEIETK
jgi:ribosomal protein S27E